MEENYYTSYSGHVADIRTPLFRVSSTVCLQLKYHMFGTNVGLLEVYTAESFFTGTGGLTRLWRQKYNQGDKYVRELSNIQYILFCSWRNISQPSAILLL